MKHRKAILGICMLCLMGMLFVSCRSHGLLHEDFDAGDTVTPEELLEMSRELFTQAEETTELPETESKESETLAPDATVYWLKSGSVYHADKQCRHISHATPEELYEGHISDAVLDGKERLCSSCAP